MSTRRVQSSAIKPRTLGTGITPWVRNPSRLALTAVGTSEEKFSGIVAVFPQSSYLALSAAGNYTVDWGDGTTANVNTGVTANHLYDFNDADLAGTNAPVDLTDTGDLVERTAHGYTNGMEVRFYNIVSTTGLTTAQVYYVINATANDFQVAATVGGAAIALTTNGSATLLPYKQAIVTVTPNGGTLTSININVKNTTSGLQAYESGWLDIEVGSPNFTGITLGGSNVQFAMCERAAVRSVGSVTNLSSLFSSFKGLRAVIVEGTASVTNMTSMFSGCTSLTTVPLFNTAAVTNMTSMFANSVSLASVPLFNTAAVTNMSSMFSSCRSLASVPLFNTAAVTDMSQMFSSCQSLTTIPLLNTENVTNMSTMFLNASSLVTLPLLNTILVQSMATMFTNCSSLASVPLFNTAAVTNMSSMFSSCNSLVSVPLFNTAAVTNMSQMFSSCSSLASVPLFNTAAVTNMSTMFNSCASLTTVPLFNTAAVTDMRDMFGACRSLISVPAFNVSAVTSGNFSLMFNACTSLSRIEAKDFRFTFSVAACRLGKTELEEIFTNLPTVTSSQTITISSNVGIQTSVTARSTTTTAQSTTSTIANTASLANGMLVIGTGTGISTGIIVVSDVSVDTLTLINHGLPDGTLVAFSSLGTTTGVSLWTIYYVVSTAANTFQVALNPGDAAIDLTGTGGNMTVRYANYITSITTDTSIVTSTPMATSGTNNLDYRTVDSASALLKNWAVTH